MKYSTTLKQGLLLALLGLMGGALSAQTPATQQAKEELAQMTGANYDTWKQSQFTGEVEPNKVLSTTLNNHHRSYLIRLGHNLLNQDAESAYETKLSDQPGVISVDADYQTNTVEITIKEEDEHDALRSLFDIE